MLIVFLYKEQYSLFYFALIINIWLLSVLSFALVEPVSLKNNSSFRLKLTSLINEIGLVDILINLFFSRSQISLSLITKLRILPMFSNLFFTSPLLSIKATPFVPKRIKPWLKTTWFLNFPTPMFL